MTGNGVRYLLAFGIPFLATLLVTPVAGRLAKRFEILDHPAPNKAHVTATPYLGGAAVAAGLLVVGMLVAGVEGQLAVILAGAIVVGGIGLVDDAFTVRPSSKLLVEGGVGAALWTAGIRAGFFGVPVLDLALTIFWVVAITNCINLLDNLDGLSSGVAAISAAAFFAIAFWQGDYLVGAFALAVAGASLGFLRYNFPPARIFLGDAGTLMLGFLLAAIGLKLDLIGPGPLVRATIVVLIFAVPIFDTTLVILARVRAGRPVYQGGTDHSSHRLIRVGLRPGQVAGLTYLAQVACCGLAFLMGWVPAFNAPQTYVIMGATFLLLLLVFLRLPGSDELEVEPRELAVAGGESR
jgi:UDP-GlcNAc:undecaprenyl-phosphate/decaprenyl-phosphate GlcNAc-1-phosphate transferase